MDNIDLLINLALKEDIPSEDITSVGILCDDQKTHGYLYSKSEYIVSGIDVARRVYKIVDNSIEFINHKYDRDSVYKGDRIFEISGSSLNILKAERVVLNFLGIMMGIATKTNYLVNLVKDTNVKLLDTRKTIPGMRNLSKKAVKDGGAYNHRFNLSDSILIKENHISCAGGIENAIKNFDISKIEIEVRNIQDLDLVLNLGIKRVLLDNFQVEDVYKAVDLNKNRAKLEVSGGINETNILRYAQTGVDYISIGALTHSVNFADISFISENV